MTDWDRYRSESVDEVFQELGAASTHPPDDPMAMAWCAEGRGGPVATGCALDPDLRGIRADIVARMASQLHLDVDDVFRRLDERGGKIL